MVPFSHVDDKICLFYYKFREKSTFVKFREKQIFVIFINFRKQFSQKCVNEFRENFRENVKNLNFLGPPHILYVVSFELPLLSFSGHNSIIYMIECQINYTADAIGE